MSPTLAIVFITCRNRQHMINNIWYKGNTNKTSVIIFSKLKIKKLPAILICFGENLRGGFCDASCCSSFHFWSSFCCCIFISFLIFILLLFFICRCSLFCCCFSFTFSFRRHPSPFRGLLASFYTHFILSAQPIAEWFATLSFSTIPLSSCRERYGLEWAFFTHRHFLPYAPSPTF